MATQRHFEFRDGKSEKFWSIKLEKEEHTVNYGRIGTVGQSKTKSFADSAKAKASFEKLIAQKISKGYIEVSGGKTKKAVKKTSSKKAKAKRTTIKKCSKKSPKSKKKTALTDSKSTSQSSFLIDIRAELPMFNHRDKRTHEPKELKLLHGFIEEAYPLSEFFDNRFSDLQLTEGYLRVEYDSKVKKLFIITDFNSPTKLDKKDLKHLQDDTAGQWSDGIGEGCFDGFMETSGYGVETCLQKLKVTQSKGVARAPKNHPFDQKKLRAQWQKAMKANQPKGSKKDFKELMIAIANEKPKKAKSLIGKVNLNQWDKFKGSDGGMIDGETPLTCACQRGNPGLVGMLIDADAEPNLPREDGDSPVHCCREEKCLKLLLDAGVSTNTKSKKYDMAFPLHRENILRSTKAIKLLLSNGANPNAADHFKKTPLENAAGDALAEATKLLLNSGAKVSEGALDSAASCVAPWDEDELAAEKMIQKTIKLLLEAGAKVTAKIVFGSISFCTPSRLKLLLSTGFNVNHPPFSQYSNTEKKRLLELAAEEDGLVDVLLKHGADASKAPEALSTAIELEDEKMIRQLLKAGAKPTKKQVESAQELDSKLVKLLGKSLK